MNAGGAFPQPVTPSDNTVGDPDNFAKFSPPSTFVAGEGLPGAIIPGGLAHRFDTKVEFHLQHPLGLWLDADHRLAQRHGVNAAALDPSRNSVT
jgi:hypothetical protein